MKYENEEKRLFSYLDLPLYKSNRNVSCAMAENRFIKRCGDWTKRNDSKNTNYCHVCACMHARKPNRFVATAVALSCCRCRPSFSIHWLTDWHKNLAIEHNSENTEQRQRERERERDRWQFEWWAKIKIELQKHARKQSFVENYECWATNMIHCSLIQQNGWKPNWFPSIQTCTHGSCLFVALFFLITHRFHLFAWLFSTFGDHCFVLWLKSGVHFKRRGAALLLAITPVECFLHHFSVLYLHFLSNWEIRTRTLSTTASARASRERATY